MSPDTPVDAPVTLPAIRPPSKWILLVLAVVLVALLVVGYSLVVTGNDRNGWRDVATQTAKDNADLRDQLSSQGEELQCRSRANFDTVASTATVIKIISALVDANNRGVPVDPAVIAQLGPAIVMLDDAIQAQDAAIPRDTEAVSTCSPEAPVRG